MILDELTNHLADLDALLKDRVTSESGVRGRGAESHAAMLYHAKVQYIIGLVKALAEQITREAEVNDRTLERRTDASEQGGVRPAVGLCHD
jgi:hypothetical protein